MKIIICTLAMVMLLLGGCQSTVTTVLEMSTAGQRQLLPEMRQPRQKKRPQC